jgi:hypothetical protein
MRSIWSVLWMATSGCYTSGPEEYECPGLEWGRYEWVVDGVTGSSGCFPCFAGGWTNARPGPSVPATRVDIGGPGGLAVPVFMAFPYCVTSLETANVEFRTGETGSVTPSVDIEGRGVAFNVRTSTNQTLGPDRCSMGGDPFGYPVPSGGRWTVLQGGSWGDIVDVEIRDVTFEVFEGHALVIPYGRWVVELPADPPEFP